MEKNKRVIYKAKGFVYGNYWGGGKGAYKSEELEGSSIKEVDTQVKEGIKDGSLDSGMGYESLAGAIMKITKMTTVIIDGKPYVNKEYETKVYGNLTDEEEDFLYEIGI